MRTCELQELVVAWDGVQEHYEVIMHQVEAVTFRTVCVMNNGTEWSVVGDGVFLLEPEKTNFNDPIPLSSYQDIAGTGRGVIFCEVPPEKSGWESGTGESTKLFTAVMEVTGRRPVEVMDYGVWKQASIVGRDTIPAGKRSSPKRTHCRCRHLCLFPEVDCLVRTQVTEMSLSTAVE